MPGGSGWPFEMSSITGGKYAKRVNRVASHNIGAHSSVTFLRLSTVEKCGSILWYLGRLSWCHLGSSSWLLFSCKHNHNGGSDYFPTSSCPRTGGQFSTIFTFTSDSRHILTELSRVYLRNRGKTQNSTIIVFNFNNKIENFSTSTKVRVSSLLTLTHRGDYAERVDKIIM